MSLAKSALVLLGLTIVASETDRFIHKNSWIDHDYTDNLKRRNERYHRYS